MKYLLDTNMCIYIMNERPSDVIHKFKKIKIGEIGVSTITISELQYGIAKSKQREKNQIRLDEFIVPLEILPYDAAAAKTYGQIRHQLENIGKPIGPLDLLIAAHAMSQKLTIVTNNDKEFKRIPNLKVVNWAT
ncbi:MAG: type II toxin-antitoxin system VapC family toxin [Pseudomonadota bacterium]